MGLPKKPAGFFGYLPGFLKPGQPVIGSVAVYYHLCLGTTRCDSD